MLACVKLQNKIIAAAPVLTVLVCHSMLLALQFCPASQGIYAITEQTTPSVVPRLQATREMQTFLALCY